MIYATPPPARPDPPVLPTMPFWKARSFWLTSASALLTAVAALDPALVYMVSDTFGWDRQPVDGVLTILAGASALLAWRERLNPTRRLALR